ncbi:NAD(P)H-hydrate dehydratase [Cellulomonas sp. DKR-3]|uniref:ADP-dependent (S)-NAD(P)H-hydrate dehydratase n=1 Tax=Cellulomonas fulva TaxID=2835530 RepID=A0ABS5U0R4_9CELL|nr:NAD(P)H-hydrate dehydratase [Cellulomonas fulva]MBT0994988.1 NAD(P)H-hydrate dehydratase [Cellulomonas fulva]
MADPAPLTPQALREWPLPRPEGGKDQRGAVLVVGGARATPGASVLAGVAALRVGAGRLTLAVTSSVAVAVAVATPEAGVLALPESPTGSPTGPGDGFADELGRADAVLVGPGLDEPDGTHALVGAVLGGLEPGVPVVLDAFALGVLPRLREQVRARGGTVVLTPNGAEARRLVDDDDEPTAQGIAARYGAVVALDGAVAAPDGRAWTSASGTTGLGTSGSGDVLAGAVAGLLAAGAAPEQAACWAVALHGTAGDRLAARVGQVGYLARELVDELPAVLTELRT